MEPLQNASGERAEAFKKPSWRTDIGDLADDTRRKKYSDIDVALAVCVRASLVSIVYVWIFRLKRLTFPLII